MSRSERNLVTRLGLRRIGDAPVHCGDWVEYDFSAVTPLDEAHSEFSFAVLAEDGALLYETLLSWLGVPAHDNPAGGEIRGRLSLPLPFAAGRLRLRLGYHSGEAVEHRAAIYIEESLVLRPREAGPWFRGLVDLGLECRPLQSLRSADQEIDELPTMLDVGESSLCLISGFYPAERNGARAFRWTGPQAMFQLGSRTGVIQFEVAASRLSVDPTPVKLRLWQDGRLAGESDLVSGQAWLEFPIRDVAGAGSIFRLECLDPWRPSDYSPGVADRRQLGIALYRVVMQPR